MCRSLARLLCPPALLLAASVSPAHAAVTIGQLAPPNSPAICGTPAFDRIPQTVTSGNSFLVPGAGTIVSWSHNAAAGAGQTLTMKIFRKIGDPMVYMIVGHDGPRPLAAGTLNSFPASVQVKPGDVLGLNSGSPAQTACGFLAAGDSHLFRPGNLADGQLGEFTLSTGGDRRNISAVFVYSNAFTLSELLRNTKKGTATLTVEVPNPGELALSGKGVRKAGAAGARVAKSVRAAGKVKLPIRTKGSLKRKLNEAGNVTLKPRITYTPTGGDPSTQSRRLKLKKR